MDFTGTKLLKTHEVLILPSFLPAGIFVFVFIVVCGWVFRIFYNLCFHPLSKIPGPWVAACSDIPYCRWLVGGRQPYKMLELHEKYGPAVRIAPNEVSFNSAQSWKDIYATRPGHQAFVKSIFYAGSTSASNGSTSIISERRPEVHKEMRNFLSSAFSDRAMKEQEELVSTTVDKFVHLVGSRSFGRRAVDVSVMFESMTFDVTCDLSFGEAFNALDSETRHPWLALAVDSIMVTSLLEIIRRFPTFATAIYVLMRNEFEKVMGAAKSNQDLCDKTIKRRLEKDVDRKDFLTRILENRDPKLVPDAQIVAHASDLVIAGSDTTATCLTAIIYYLLRDPYSLSNLTAEIRGTFEQYAQINGSSTAQMQYLRAVILEGLRLYPPAPYAPPRVVPPSGDTVDGLFLPGGTIVSTNHFAASLSPKHFEDPWAFKPERWINPDGNHIENAMQPFLLGPRGCIGRNLAMLELRTTLAKLFWVYDMELADPTLDWHRDSRGYLLWEKPALMVHARNRGVTI